MSATATGDGLPADPRAAVRAWLDAAREAYGHDLIVPPRDALLAAARAAMPAAREAGTPDEPATEVGIPPGSSTAERLGDLAERPGDPAELPGDPAELPGDPAELPGDPAELPGDLDALRAEVLPCTRCKLAATRNNVVFGEGSPSAEVLFIGEAPGQREDELGRPFVGRAGQLLDRIIENAMGLRREDVYIANVNKCRPPGNRDPEPDEIAACLPYLRAQVRAIGPKVIVVLGRVAARNLLGTTRSMGALRGRELAYEGVPVVATWHPAYLLRSPDHKRETWDDIKRVNRLLGRPEDPRDVAGETPRHG